VSLLIRLALIQSGIDYSKCWMGYHLSSWCQSHPAPIGLGWHGQGLFYAPYRFGVSPWEWDNMPRQLVPTGTGYLPSDRTRVDFLLLSIDKCFQWYREIVLGTCKAGQLEGAEAVERKQSRFLQTLNVYTRLPILPNRLYCKVILASSRNLQYHQWRLAGIQLSRQWNASIPKPTTE